MSTRLTAFTKDLKKLSKGYSLRIGLSAGYVQDRFEFKFSQLRAQWTLLLGRHRETVNILTAFMGVASVTIPGVLPMNIWILLQSRGLLWSILKKQRRALLQCYSSSERNFSCPDPLPRFDALDGFIPNYKNCVCLGIMPQPLKLWLEGEYHDCSWYTGTKVSHSNNLLLAIPTVTEIICTTRRFQ